MKKTKLFVRPPHPEVESAHSATNPSIPSEVLGCIQSILSNFIDREAWEAVRQAIMFPVQHASETPPESEERFLSTEEIGELLHVSRPTIFRYMKAGKIKAHKLGRRNLFSLNEVIATLKNAEVTNV